MNAGQHLGNTKLILENLEWLDVSFNPTLINYFQVLNWLPDYISLIDLVGKFIHVGIVDYFPMYLPFLGWPGFNFFSMKKMISELSDNTIITSEEKLFHKFHFDSLLSFNDVVDHWNWLEQQVRDWIRLTDKQTNVLIQQHMLISVLAESLHAVQDFYSHSNWIELLYQTFNLSTKEEFPTWFDIFVENKSDFSNLKYDLVELFDDPNILYTGYFPIGKDKKNATYYHNDKKNKPGLNKDRSERPFFDVVYHLAYKNGIQWLNYIKKNYLDEKYINLMNKPLPEEIVSKTKKIQPYVKTIAYKLREWNGLEPFKNLKLEVLDPILKGIELFFTVKVSTTDPLVKYDRDFRKSFFKIIIKSNNELITEIKKFGKKSGKTNFKLKLGNSLEKERFPNLLLRVEYGLLYKESLIIKEY